MQLYMYIMKRIPSLYLIYIYILSYLQWYFRSCFQGSMFKLVVLFWHVSVKRDIPAWASRFEKVFGKMSQQVVQGIDTFRWCLVILSLRNRSFTQEIITEYLQNCISISYLCYTDPTKRPPLLKLSSRSNQVPFFSLSFFRSFFLFFFLSWRKPLAMSMCLHICATTSCTSALSQTRTHSPAHVLKHRLILL